MSYISLYRAILSHALAKSFWPVRLIDALGVALQEYCRDLFIDRWVVVLILEGRVATTQLADDLLAHLRVAPLLELLTIYDRDL